ncbi:ABC transporter ATP-binding protein [Nocardioides sp.]|uniref:ABC transporter ATP-binding protein n=1 Tax=Nocardioides sp. TaxID=35761 RepID=UPI002734CBE2|nr:ABC transporter ATP-binding protein [Nocardioides sp.]MDP3895020.1 ABC transporter ATP-binding protein [Nocardioides sp.]
MRSTTAPATCPHPAAEASPPAISMRGVAKHFGETIAVRNLDLDIVRGELFSMLGPSGSGKTTVLRMIAGFERPTAGRILLDGADVTDKAPFDREVNTVFQDYALFPHMSVADNVGYGLSVRKVAREELRRQVAGALDRVHLGHLADRFPSQLSGGQRQRVALARALVLRPRVLLLDEPLGALDRKLREQMQIELKAIQREVGITFVLVTHDQDEALTLSDRVAVFHEGGIEQVGTPTEVYERPATTFVAGFLGAANIVEPELSEGLFGRRELLSIRPERLRLSVAAPANGGPELSGVVTEVVYSGPATTYVVELRPGMTVMCTRPAGDDAGHRRGDAVHLSWSPGDLYAIPGSPTTPTTIKEKR